MLKKCPYCGKEISDKSDSCIHCGAKLDDSKKVKKQSNSKNKIILIAAILMVLVVAVGFLFLKNTDKKKTEEEISQEEVSQEEVSIITEDFAKKVNEFDEIISAHFPDFSIAFFAGDSTNPVACVGKNGLYGLINLKGDLVVPLEYESPIMPMIYNSNVAVVKKNGKFGVLNLHDFSEVVACSFDNSWDDIKVALKNESLWLKKNGKYGLCDNKGKMLTSFLYSDVSFNSNEAFSVCKNGKWGFITKNGEEISSTFVYKNILVPSLLTIDVGYFVGESKNNNYVALDSTGTIIPEKDYENWKSKYGIKRVYDVVGEKYGCKGGKYGYKGDGFKEGLACVQENEKYGFIDEQGNVVVPIEYDQIVGGGFNNGIAIVIKYGDFGLVNAKGELVLPCEYEECMPYSNSNGVIRVMKNNKYGLWHKDKGLVVPCQYDYVSGFYDGLARVSLKNGNEYVDSDGAHITPVIGGYVDMEGKVVIPLIYDLGSDFSYGLAAVSKNGKMGFVDKTGHTTFQK